MYFLGFALESKLLPILEHTRHHLAHLLGRVEQRTHGSYQVVVLGQLIHHLVFVEELALPEEDVVEAKHADDVAVEQRLVLLNVVNQCRQHLLLLALGERVRRG